MAWVGYNSFFFPVFEKSSLSLNLLPLFSFFKITVAQIPPVGQLNLPAKRPFTDVDTGEEETHLNSKQRKFLKFQKRFQKKSCE